MRLAPVPMYFAGDPAEAIRRAADSSRTTHRVREAVDACRYFAGLLVGALRGVEKETLLSADYCPVAGLWEREPLAGQIARVAGGSFAERDPPEIQGSGYVVRSLEAALWAFSRARDFREGALLAVNLGDDADTTGAIYGQLAGAHYGAGAIPAPWREQLAMEAEIATLADRLHEHSRRTPSAEQQPGSPSMRASVREQALEIAGVRVRRLNIVVSGHTLQQLLFFDIVDAEAVHGRPFDDDLDAENPGRDAGSRSWGDRRDDAQGRVRNELDARRAVHPGGGHRAL